MFELLNQFQMDKVTRTDFLRYSMQIGAVAMLNGPFGTNLLLSGNAAPGRSTDAVMNRVLAGNDKQAAILLASLKKGKPILSRKLGFDFAVLSSSYCYPASDYYHSRLIIPALEGLLKLLKEFQSDDGTLNFSNLESPPDTAFLMEPLIAGAHLLAAENRSELQELNIELKEFILKTGEALVTGGVHTPNHRWLICGVLARLNALYPDQEYISRIEDWLGEGVYNDDDGHFLERSVNYAVVENTGLITIGRLLNRPSLFDPVRKNLMMTWFYMEPNGDLVSTDSRRQDQYNLKTIVPYYLHYRYLAIRDKNPHFAGITRLIEKMKGFDEIVSDRFLFHFLDNPLLQQDLPDPVQPIVNFEKLFISSHLLRIRNGDTTATLFGGVDWPLIISSGRSNSPDFFSFRKGHAILKHVRLSSEFFNMGYFYSEGIRKEGNQYLLHKKNEVPYYQPLPKALRNGKGDYKLTPSTDGRFWNKMDFQHRPVSNVKTLETSIRFLQSDQHYELHFTVTGLAGLRVTIELCFNEEGILSGVSDLIDGNYFLEQGRGVYECKGDSIKFGPGATAHKNVSGLEGEMYSSHFGSLRTEGKHVYITGMTPFSHHLVFS